MVIYRVYSVFPVYCIPDDNFISLSIFVQATLGFFALPNEPSDVVNPLIDNLITLLCAILVTRYSVCYYLPILQIKNYS